VNGPSRLLRPRCARYMIVAPMQTLPAPGTRGLDHETTLAARIRAGDEEAFETVFRSHAVRLADFACAFLGSRDDAEDVVQAIFTRLWLTRDRLDPRAPLAAHLMLATRNEVRDRIKHNRVVARWQAEVRQHASDFGPAATPGCDDEFDARDTAAAICASVAGLPPQRRAACTLRWVHGLSYSEIATKLHIAPRTVERHLALAYKALRTHLPMIRPQR
jgi:RNA polymerase sigma-70 factor (family 1)